MKTEYHLEIYEPGDDKTVAAFYTNDMPFANMNVGDIIAGGSLNMSVERLNLRVVGIKHIIWKFEGQHLAHKICVSTEVAQ